MTSLAGSVLVAGAGDVGLGLAARLVAHETPVSTLNRSGRGVDGATVVRADLGDPTTLRALPAVDTVVFTTAPPGRDEAAYRLAYRDGPRNLLAALPAPPTRVILTSTTGVYGIDDGGWVDETSPIAPTRPTARIVREGERHLLDHAPVSILRPAGIYGPGRAGLWRSVAAGDAPVAADGTIRWTNRVHRDDVVSALFTLAGHPDPPAAVNAVDDEPTPRDDVIRWLATRLGAPTPSTIAVDRVSGKRIRNTALRSLGWTPQYPTFREGYASFLD